MLFDIDFLLEKVCRDILGIVKNQEVHRILWLE